MLTINIDLKPQTEQRLKHIFANQGDAEHFFQDFITYKISQLEKSNFNIEKDLRRYERQYNIPSKEFYEQFEAGKYGDEDDYMIWSGIYEMLLENKTELIKLRW